MKSVELKHLRYICFGLDIGGGGGDVGVKQKITQLLLEPKCWLMGKKICFLVFPLGFVALAFSRI